MTDNSEAKIVWQPLPGSQAAAISCPCNELLYEGSRGPGKTDAQVMFFRSHVGKGYGSYWRGIIFDRQYSSLEDLIAKSKRWFPEFGDGAKFLSSKGDLKWVWPTGEELLFRQITKEGDYNKYHGHEYPFIGWNELTKFANGKCYDIMKSCNRSGFLPLEHTPHKIEKDGSKVWLNSGSTLRFPTSFVGSERIVELKGEAYFDITKNSKMPFLVRTNNAMDIKVLGTQFNVMAYDDEKNINTTLIEGSVEVLKGSGKTMLKPGQEAILNRGSGNIKVAEADLEQAIAWKNGYFIFYNENIESIMRKVSRWYNVDVVYQGNLSNKDFVGTISRNKNVSELLKMLELTGAVHFSIDGRRITVMP